MPHRIKALTDTDLVDLIGRDSGSGGLSPSCKKFVEKLRKLEELEAAAKASGSGEPGRLAALHVASERALIVSAHDGPTWFPIEDGDWKFIEDDADLRGLVMRHAGWVFPSLALPGVETENLPKLEHDWVNSDIPLSELQEMLARMNGGGMLLYGPPGTGKSLLAAHLGAAIGLKPMVVTPDTYLRWRIGETESIIANLFRSAEAGSFFLVLDDFESLAWSRAMAVRSWEVSQLAVLLRYMQAAKVPFAATTNQIGIIDPAALRRFVVKAEIRAMTREQRRLAFRTLWNSNPPTELDQLVGLTASDFESVARRIAATDSPRGPREIVAMLAREAGIKAANAEGTRSLN